MAVHVMGRHDTALSDACRCGELAEVAALIADGADVNEPLFAGPHRGVTPLLVAAHRGHAEITSALLAAGATINHSNEDGLTPLLIACQKGRAEVISVLLAAGASVDQGMADGTTPLIVVTVQHRTVLAALTEGLVILL